MPNGVTLPQGRKCLLPGDLEPLLSGTGHTAPGKSPEAWAEIPGELGSEGGRILGSSLLGHRLPRQGLLGVRHQKESVEGP